MIQFLCPCCGTSLEVADNWNGGQVPCPKSGQLIYIPAASSPAGQAPGDDEGEDMAGIAQAFGGSSVIARPGRAAKSAEEARQFRDDWLARGMLVGGASLCATIAACIYAQTFDFFGTLLAALVGSGLGVVIGPMLKALAAAKDQGAAYGAGKEKPPENPLASVLLAVGAVLVGSTLGAGSGASFGNIDVNPGLSMTFAGIGTVLGVVPGTVWWLKARKIFPKG